MLSKMHLATGCRMSGDSLAVGGSEASLGTVFVASVKSDFNRGKTNCQNPTQRPRMYSLTEVTTPVIRKVAGPEEKMTTDGR